MATTTTTSTQFSLNLSDIWKGLLMAVIVPVFAIITDSLNQGSLTFNWKLIGIAALSGGIGYILKNFLTPSAIVVKDVHKETVKAVEAGNITVTVGGQAAPVK